MSFSQSLPIDASKPKSSVCNFFRPQSGVVTVGLFNDILEKAGIWFGRVGSWPAAVLMSLLFLVFG